MFWWPYLLRVVSLKEGGERREKAGSEDRVYVISFSEKFQTHSSHSLIKPHISPINRCGEHCQSVSQRNEATYPNSTKPWQGLIEVTGLRTLSAISFFHRLVDGHTWLENDWTLPLICSMLSWDIVLIFETLVMLFMYNLFIIWRVHKVPSFLEMKPSF